MEFDQDKVMQQNVNQLDSLFLFYSLQFSKFEAAQSVKGLFSTGYDNRLWTMSLLSCIASYPSFSLLVN